MALKKDRQVFRYIELSDPEGKNDFVSNPEAALLRGLAVVCLIIESPEDYGYYVDHNYAIVPHRLTQTLARAQPGEIVQPGEAKYVFSRNGGNPLYYIQRVHLTNERPLFVEEPKLKKMRRASAIF